MPKSIREAMRAACGSYTMRAKHINITLAGTKMADKPRIGESVYALNRQQPNGVIFNVNFSDEEVFVKFHETNNIETFSFDHFWDFNERLNQWRIDDS